jgi:hypothetical protein
MTTTVVHCKKDKHDVYIGRPSKWGNPFSIGKDGTRDEVIVKYSFWIINQPDLMAALPELKDKILGCWCRPQACHGDILAQLADALPEYNEIAEVMRQHLEKKLPLVWRAVVDYSHRYPVIHVIDVPQFAMTPPEGHKLDAPIRVMFDDGYVSLYADKHSRLRNQHHGKPMGFVGRIELSDPTSIDQITDFVMDRIGDY